MKINVNILLLSLLLILGGLISFSSCEKNRTCKETNNSSAGSTESHNFGQNCLACHTKGEKGEGCFNIAGSVSDSLLTSPLTAGKVHLYSLPNGGGTLMYSFDIDGKGNFHTTNAVDYTGLYAVVESASGNKKYMSSSLSSGACNACHGVTTSKLWGN